MKKRALLYSVCGLFLISILGLYGCGDGNNRPSPSPEPGPEILVEQDVTVPGGGGSFEVSFLGSSGQTIRITLTASNTSIEPYGYLTYPDGTGEYTPLNENAQNGENMSEVTLNQTGTYDLSIMDGANIGGTVHVRVEVITGPPLVTPATLVQLSDFNYLGAFRLPGGEDPPASFNYGGNAMTFRPDGDPTGGADGYPGSLFITGHDWNSYVAEISIPVPVISKNPAELNQAEFLQGFNDVKQGLFGALEIPKIGMHYLSTSATGAKIHMAWGQHIQDEAPSHIWIDPNLSTPNAQGTWYIGNQSIYSVIGYMFGIPASWADIYTGGRYLATGAFRDGGWSGQGPSLFAYRPWIDENGTPAPTGTRLQETVLLLYARSTDTEDVVSHSLNNYQHPDEWEGGAWITSTTGKTAVMFAGTKGTGAKYWYGYINPAGPEFPCTYSQDQYECRLSDGNFCPSGDYAGCANPISLRGWWSARFDAQIILYDPADLARVTSGETESWEPQPYAVMDIDDYLLLNPPANHEDMLGFGVQRKYRIGAVAYDSSNDLIYVLELFADGARPVVHVWHVR